MVDNTTVTRMLIEDVPPYEPRDYFGEFNLLRDEKIAIFKAAYVAKGNRLEMSKLLGISERGLYVKMMRHQITDQVKKIKRQTSIKS